MRDPSRRAELLAQLLPLDAEMRALVSQFTYRPTDPTDAVIYDAMFRSATQPVLIALKDARSISDAKTEAASTNATLSRMGQLKLLTGDWLAATDLASQLNTLDKVGALLNTFDVNSKPLESAVTRIFTENGLTDYATEQWRSVLLTNFPNKNLIKYAAALSTFKKEKQTLYALENKRLILQGTTSDGKPFSTQAWKGKVILVDFWATWCGPCKAELPRVKQIYQKYHAQGLEVLGVSTDRTVQILNKYLAADPGLAWPCLFDDKWEGDRESRPLSVRFGIPGLPTMLLIDRQGVCRTVEARSKMEQMIPELLHSEDHPSDPPLGQYKP